MNESGERLSNPELKINIPLLDVLNNLGRILSERKKTDLLVSDKNSVSLKSGQKEIASITADNIFVAGKDFSEKLQAKDKKISNSELNSEQINNFFNNIAGNIKGINHLGINYSSEDVESETEEIKKLANSNGLKLYEEKAPPELNQKWLYVGDTKNWRNPLFEVVLNEGEQGKSDGWKPHFQIDIDTNLSIEEIKNKTKNSFGKDFITWQLDIPNFGVVLGMGLIGKENETKIALGIGTNLRNTEVHRTEELKEI